MSKEREALKKIVDDKTLDFDQIHDIATKALQSESENTYTQAEFQEQVKFATESYERGYKDHIELTKILNPKSESRMYSEEEVRKNMYWAINMCKGKLDSGLREEDIIDELELKLQSIQPKTEELTSVLSWGNNGELLSTPKEQPKMEECETCNVLGSPCYFHEPKEQPTSPSLEKMAEEAADKVFPNVTDEDSTQTELNEWNAYFSGFIEGYKANNYLEDVEHWIGENIVHVSGIGFTEWEVVSKDDLLKYIQTLKP